MELEQLKSYEILEKYDLKDIASVGYRMVHKKTGARIALIVNDDSNKVFSIAFRTPPSDSTGAFRTLRIQGIPAQGSFCGACKGIAQYIPQCHDLSG